jgi:cell division protein FtsN
VSQDFAKSKPRKPRKNVRNKPKRALPPWLWLVTGLCAGLLLSFLYHLASIPAEPADNNGQATETDRQEPDDSVEFNFYTLLPQREVLVSTERQPARTRPEENPPKRSADDKAEAGYYYYLQAGSFQQRDEAEKRRIQLILLDLDASIEKVRHQGKSWYRVQSGPYLSSAQLASAQGKLGAERIDTLVTKRKAQE